jgi:hypothetical protein
MQRSPYWEASSCLGSQDITIILYNPKVHYRVHYNPQPEHILSRFNPIYNLSTQFLASI